LSSNVDAVGHCTVSPCSAKSRPSRSVSSSARSPMITSITLRMIRLTTAS
jgi:hypothetical protein